MKLLFRLGIGLAAAGAIYLLFLKTKTPTYSSNRISNLIADQPDQQADAILLQGDSLRYLGQFNNAIAVYENKVKAGKGNIAIWNRLAYCYLFSSKTSLACRYLDSLHENRALMNKSELADFQFSQGKYNILINQPANAIRLLQKAHRYYLGTYGEKHLKTVNTIIEMGLYYRNFTLLLDSAIHFIDQAQAVFEFHSELDHLSSFYYYAHAWIAMIKRDHIAGVTYADIAITKIRGALYPDTLLLAKSYFVKGRMHSKMGQMSRAVTAQNQAIELAEASDENNYAQLFHGELVLYYSKFQDPSNFERKLHLLNTKYTPQELTLVSPHRYRAYRHFILKNYKEAIYHYKHFIQEVRERKLLQYRELGEAFYFTSLMYTALEQFDSAQWYIEKNLELEEYFHKKEWEHIWEQSPNIPSMIFLGQLARIYTQAYEKTKDNPGQLKQAFRIYQRIDSLLFQQIGEIEEEAILVYLKEVANGVYDHAIKTAYLLYQHSPDREYVDWANIFMERMKSFVLFRDHLANRLVLIKTPGTTLRASERKLITELERLKQKKRLGEVSFKENLELAELLVKQKMLYFQLKTNFPWYFGQKIQQKIPKIEAIQKKFAFTNSGVIQYKIIEDAIFSLYIDSSSVNFLKVQKPANYEILLSNFNVSVTQPTLDSGLSIFRQYGSALFEIYFGAHWESMQHLSALTIIPDAEMHHLPLDLTLFPDTIAMKTNSYERLPYLLKKIAMRQSYALKSFMMTSDRPIREDAKVLGFAFSDRNNKLSNHQNKLQELPYSSDELNIVRRYFPSGKSQYFTGVDCQKSLFKKHAEKGIQLLHLATHAVSSRDQNENIVFFKSLKNHSGIDSLFIHEIMALNLSEVNLAVLSACNTGIGDYRTGEGNYSLTRSFLQAGVRNVVASLWNLEDYSTSQIISLFYKHINQQDDIAKALQAAKIEYLNTCFPNLSHPAYWASFVFVY